jgi:hypothetical protein
MRLSNASLLFSTITAALSSAYWIYRKRKQRNKQRVKIIPVSELPSDLFGLDQTLQVDLKGDI